MAVIMIAEAPGADASFIDGMRAAGVADRAGAGAWVRGPHQRRREQRVSRHRGVGVPGGPPGLVRRPRRAEPTARHGPIPFGYVEMLLASPES